MTTKHQRTQEEDAYWRLLEETGEVRSEAACTLLSAAKLAAHDRYLLYKYFYQPLEYDEAMEKMRLAATKLTDRDCEILKEIWRTALAAAASIDPDDKSYLFYRIVSGRLHYYFRMLSGMVEEVLEEKERKEMEERRKNTAESEPEDLLDCPF